MSSKTIAAVINVRLHSTRVERKMIRNFGGTSLLHIALSKFKQLNMNKYLALCSSEEEIMKICQDYRSEYKFIFRDEASIIKGRADQRVSFRHYDEIPATHILWINPCAPFLSTETVCGASDFFMKNDFVTMTSVKLLTNIVFDSSFAPMNVESSSVSSQGNSTLYEMAHLFHVFDRDAFKNKGFFWDYSKNNPYCYPVETSKECLDVDGVLDFEICEALYSLENSNTHMQQN